MLDLRSLTEVPYYEALPSSGKVPIEAALTPRFHDATVRHALR
jgi:hypothetical protein